MEVKEEDSGQFVLKLYKHW